MKKSFFTLVELLVVIGIILLLAGLLVPAVSGVQKQGRVTQAKSDMATISTALSALAADNGGRYLTKSGARYKVNTKSFSDNVEISLFDTDAMNFILELSDPSSSRITINNNKRKVRYLEPSANYQGNVSPGSGTKDQFWPDPWGNPYNFTIIVNGSGKIDNVHSNSDKAATSHTIYKDFAIWSNGPDGVNEGGCNVDADNHGSSTADDVASWHK